VLPSSAFWRFSLDFYQRPDVATACLALQDRHRVDVNLLLLAIWLGTVGHRLDPAAGRHLSRLGAHWQRPLVTPLRRVRRRLKQRRASPQLPWPEVIELCRGRLAEIELALEQAEQLLLERAVGSIHPGQPDDATARADLRALGLGRIIGTTETALLLKSAFGPPAAP
jgi:uncharacterized protein (TIGR02444 family)